MIGLNRPTKGGYFFLCVKHKEMTPIITKQKLNISIQVTIRHHPLIKESD